MVFPIGPCVPSPRMSKEALVRIPTIISGRSFQQRRLFKTNSVPSSSSAAVHVDEQQQFASISNSSIPIIDLKDIHFTSLKIQETTSKYGKLFETDHSLSSKSTAEIIRALSIYHLCSFPIFVSNGRKLYNLSSSLLGHKITDGILKKTFFAHFCGGKSEFPIHLPLKSA
jgi:hypothetical protein